MDAARIYPATGGLLVSPGPIRRCWYEEASDEMTDRRNALCFFWRPTLIWQVFKRNLLKMSPQQHAGSQAVQSMTPITIKLGGGGVKRRLVCCEQLLSGRIQTTTMLTDVNQTMLKSLHRNLSNLPLHLYCEIKHQSDLLNMTWNLLLSCKNTKHERSYPYIFVFVNEAKKIQSYSKTCLW